MNKVITINLNGRAYQLEEGGYEALRRYLDEARAKLGDNPDVDEIMADFEQAIADKCDAYLNPQKTVVTAKEMEEIISKMGPVDGAGAAASGAAKAEPSKPISHKRLFRIREGAWFFGVCNGLAAFFNVDVAIVRVLFVLFGALTHIVGGIIIYVILAVIMRPAETDDDMAAAHGAAPFTAHEFIEQARAEYARFGAEHANFHDKHEWKMRVRQLKQEWRAKRREWYRERHAERADAYARQYAAYAGRERGGPRAAAIVGGIIIAILTILWILALVAFLTTGVVFGFVFGFGHPIWLSLVFLTALYYILITPFKLMLMNARCRRYGSDCRHYHGWIFMRTLFFLIALGLLFYTAAHLFPSVGVWWQSAGTFLNSPR